MENQKLLSNSSDDSKSTDGTKEQSSLLSSLLKKHDYTIKEELGQVVNGKVFLVTSEEGNCYVAKMITYTSKKDLSKVEEEVKILKELNHPYIVDYEQSIKDEESGLFVIVMEYCEGGDLYKRMQKQKKQGFFEEQQIIDWLVQICLALQHVHKKNILHRDIKPQNVFLSEYGYIELGDFGCSKLLDGADVYAKSVVGAELYVSPDVLQQNYDFKCDIWSLGWLLHDLCMLDVWSDIIERRVLHACSLRGTPPPISDRYSEELQELIRQMLSHDHNSRPSIEEILAKPFLRQAVNRNKRIPTTLEKRFVEATECIEDNYKKLKDFLSEWNEITDSLEETHRKCTIASLSGSVIGAAGGITALVGAILAPFTFGASLIVSGVGIGVGFAGGTTSAVSNITNSVKQKRLREKLEQIGEKYSEVIQLILNSPEILMLLRKIQKIRLFKSDALFDDINWLVSSDTFMLLHAVKLSLQLFLTGVEADVVGTEKGGEAFVETCVEAGVEAGIEAGVEADIEACTEATSKADVVTGARAGAQVGLTVAQAGVTGARAVVAGARAGARAGMAGARAGARAAAAATEVAVAVVAVSGVLSGLLIIADAAFIAIDSREIHQIRQGKIDDPKNVKSSILKGIAQMRKMQKEFENVLEGIINTRKAVGKKINQESE